MVSWADTPERGRCWRTGCGNVGQEKMGGLCAPHYYESRAAEQRNGYDDREVVIPRPPARVEDDGRGAERPATLGATGEHPSPLPAPRPLEADPYFGRWYP